MRQDTKGKVYLVGAGPGDPGLITVKGKRLIEQADVIVYDYLANDILLQYARPEAEKIYVGKKAGSHTMRQEDINKLLVEKGRKFLVVRLKGGDPFVFGRGAEEALALREANIDFEVVPGVTAATSVPAYAGIALSHRDFTPSMTFVTGHEREDQGGSRINWKALAEMGGTLVFFMGVRNLELIVSNLLKHNLSPETPVAVIQWGTTPKQRTITGDLSNISDLVKSANIAPPALIVVGEVVKLRPLLNWFEEKPLLGKTIVVTRARSQASQFREILESLGAYCIEFPTIEIIPTSSWEDLDKSLDNLPQYSWIIFTSVNGVRFFFQRLWSRGMDVRSLQGISIAAIGSETAKAIETFGIRVDFVPESYRAEDLVKGFPEEAVRGKRVLIPRAAEARELLPETLRNRGAEVDIVPVYKTVIPEKLEAQKAVKHLLEDGVDCITFTSSSTVHNFFNIMRGSAPPMLKKAIIAAIGPVTAATAKEYGLEVNVVPQTYTIEGLVDALVEYFSKG